MLAAYRTTGDPAFKAAADRMLEFLLHQAPRSPKGLIFHNQAENRIWVDSFYMAPPFLAVAGHPDEAVRQVEGYRETLRAPRRAPTSTSGTRPGSASSASCCGAWATAGRRRG